MTAPPRILLLACLGVGLCATAAGARPRLELAGAHFPAALRVAGAALLPASCGIRDTLWIDHYATVLYVPRGSDATAAADPHAPAAVMMRMIETRYMPDQIPGKWLNALEATVPPRNLALIRKAYRLLHDGDEVLLRYRPGAGVDMRVNGKAVTTLHGRAAVDAILAAWADDEPVDRKLRRLEAEQPCN